MSIEPKGEAMQCRSAVLAAGSSVVAVSFLAFVSSVTAGPEKIKFPQYQTHVLYDVLDQAEFKEVRELFANPEALKGLKAGQLLPSGSVLSAPTFKALLDDKGEFVRDANGRLVRGRLDRIVVMEKRTGWGAEYSDALRNGEWEYATFEANGTLRTSSNLKACFECHKPKASDDFVFSLPQLLKVAR
jgi:Cytochrome P460